MLVNVTHSHVNHTLLKLFCPAELKKKPLRNERGFLLTICQTSKAALETGLKLKELKSQRTRQRFHSQSYAEQPTGRKCERQIETEAEIKPGPIMSHISTDR